MSLTDDLLIYQASALPLGTKVTYMGIRFALALPDDGTEVRLNIMNKNDHALLCQICMNDYPAGGQVAAVLVSGIMSDGICYQYVDSSRHTAIADPYAGLVHGAKSFGTWQPENERLIYELDAFHYNWEQDTLPKIPYDSMILYKLHVRGFTMHPSSRVRHRGTFSAIIEKIPYLKSLGVNAIELMPVMDFPEAAKAASPSRDRGPLPSYVPSGTAAAVIDDPSGAAPAGQVPAPEMHMNYWGYGEAQFFAPKAAYAHQDPREEFRAMIKALHAQGIEVILEMLFVAGTPQSQILDCLRHWAIHYHVDGFHVNSEIVSMDMAATDPLLAEVKLICGGIDAGRIYDRDTHKYLRLATANDAFQNVMRCFLKGDGNCIQPFMEHNTGRTPLLPSVNYITTNNGFTLADLVSFNEKHNEANGEDNRDGSDYNHSWNCGAEGPTRSHKIRALRRRQMLNAMTLLIFQQGVPMLYAGDEFANSQQGNNNAYCQDNEISWLNWNDQKKNRQLFKYVQALIRLRREHPILHPKKPYRTCDYLNCGIPDLSFHGKNPWYPEYDGESRYVGVMYCGHYAPVGEKDDDTFYFAYNMHWEPISIALPTTSRGLRWQTWLNTFEPAPLQPQELADADGKATIPPRTIVVFISRADGVEDAAADVPGAVAAADVAGAAVDVPVTSVAADVPDAGAAAMPPEAAAHNFMTEAAHGSIS